jgi:acyl-CoA synthetase (AMP-forming)/AMP-acid ligase II
MMGKFSTNVMANWLLGIAKYNPAGEFIIYGDERIRWARLKSRSFRIANALRKLGVNKGDKVAFMFHNVPAFLEINYGIQVAGAIPVPINYRFIPREVVYQANHSDAKIFIYDERWKDAVEPAAAELPSIEHWICLGSSTIKGAIGYDAFVNSGDDSDPQVPTVFDDIAVMIYTGGTTGFPKGVMLTYQAHIDMFATFLAFIIIRGAMVELTPEKLKGLGEALPLPLIKFINPIVRSKFMRSTLKKPSTHQRIRKVFNYALTHPEAARFGYKRTIKYMVPSMPFFHDASYQILVLAAMLGNLCFVLIPSVKFEPALILEAVQKEKVLFMANVPTGWKKLVSFPDFDKYDVSSVKTAATGAGACPASLKQKMFARFPAAVVIDMFGQTEMTPITTFRIDGDVSTLKERSVGQSIVEAKVVDENGCELPTGQIGEILYKSGSVMKGYYKDEDKTREVIDADGWFRGGDLGYIDDDGEIRLVDRKKECINTGGEKVFPLEVEEILHLHPKVDDVCIIGIPDEEWGSTIRAVVQLKKGETASDKEIIEFARDQLAGYKLPRSVVFVDELPLSPVGKVLRQKIRDLYGC